MGTPRSLPSSLAEMIAHFNADADVRRIRQYSSDVQVPKSNSGRWNSDVVKFGLARHRCCGDVGDDSGLARRAWVDWLHTGLQFCQIWSIAGRGIGKGTPSWIRSESR